MGAAITATSVVLPGFYAKYTVAGLAGVAMGLVAARITEVVTDPVIGHLTDITRSRLGPRKPWLLLGAVLAPICTLELLSPSSTATAFYYVLWTTLACLTWTLINIPLRAWAVELSRDYDVRSTIFAVLGIAYVLGAIVFAASPFLPFFATTEMRPSTLRSIGIGLAVAIPFAVLTAVVAVPQGFALNAERPSLSGLWGALKGNRPLWRFLVTYVLGGIAQSMVLACFFFFADAHLHLGPKLPLALLVLYLGGLLGMPVWLALMLRLGKPRAWGLGYAMMGLAGCALSLIPRGPHALTAFLIGSALYGFASSVDALAPFAVLGDVIDYDHWRTRKTRAGNYNALTAVVQKASYAVGGALAFSLLGAVDYDVSGRTESPTARLMLLFAFAGLPALLYAACAVIVWGFPLDRRRQTLIRRRLEQRAARAATGV
jgi:glycoside/pentoside/hexuronide:cation symporter, GPH family